MAEEPVSEKEGTMPGHYDLPPVKFIQMIDGEYGLSLSDHDAEWLMWERTGWPEFWPRGFDSPAEAFEAQVRDQLRCLADHGTFTPDGLEGS